VSHQTTSPALAHSAARPVVTDNMKYRVVAALEFLCSKTHWLVHRRPFIYVIPPCGLTLLSIRLDDRWNTGYWKDRRRG